MDEAGVAIINVGFPALSEDEKRTVKRIVNETFTYSKLTASAEATKNSINACFECGIKEITIESPINGLNLQYKLKITKEQALQRIVDIHRLRQKTRHNRKLHPHGCNPHPPRRYTASF